MNGRKPFAATLLVIFVMGGLAAPWFHRLHHTFETWREARAEVPVAFEHPDADVPAFTRAHVAPLVTVSCVLCVPKVYEPEVRPIMHQRLPRRFSPKAEPHRLLSALERPPTLGRAPPARV